MERDLEAQTGLNPGPSLSSSEERGVLRDGGDFCQLQPCLKPLRCSYIAFPFFPPVLLVLAFNGLVLPHRFLLRGERLPAGHCAERVSSIQGEVTLIARLCASASGGEAFPEESKGHPQFGLADGTSCCSFTPIPVLGARALLHLGRSSPERAVNCPPGAGEGGFEAAPRKGERDRSSGPAV